MTDAEGSGSEAEMTPDAVLLEAADVARAALIEITPESTIGSLAGHRVEGEHVLSLLFENSMRGYPGWFWTVTLSRVGDGEPNVLEVELLPGDNALLAPDWVPWSERLAEYRATQEQAEADARALAEASALDGDDELELDTDDDSSDDEDDDEEYSGSSLLHAGDLDGVDVDELDEESEDDSDDDDDDSDDDDSDDDDSDDDDDDSDEDDDSEGDRSY